MNQFINKILREAKEDDSFFKPKDISKRDEEMKRELKKQQQEKKNVILNVKKNLKKLKHLKNNLDEESIEYFIISIFENYKVMDSLIKYGSFFLIDENNKRRVNISVERRRIYVSHKYISDPIYRFFRQRGNDINMSENTTRIKLSQFFDNVLGISGFSVQFGYMITKNTLEENKNEEDDLIESENSGNEYESSYDIKRNNNDMYNPSKLYDDFYEKENTNEKSHEIWVTP